ncbi:hypothetical protein [Streptomyces afghaniensis]|uniref:hypothetical protein n=1 Tax=Streptomyces afghaniensis TaxID=66865 RepID=UPI0037AE6BB2
MDIALITVGQMYRYYLRQVLVGDGRRPARKALKKRSRTPECRPAEPCRSRCRCAHSG